MSNNIQSTINNQQSTILDVLKYFSIFNYPPNREEIHTFLKKRCSRRRLVSILEKMEKNKIVNSQLLIVNRKNHSKITISNQQLAISHRIDLPRYTLHQYIKKLKTQNSKLKTNNQQSAINNFLKRQQISVNKLNSRKFRLYVKLLSVVPAIKLIGLSGSVAMLNADENHDVDLFIITGRNRLWTGRIIALLLAQLLGVRRMRQSADLKQLTINNQQFKDRVCLNLFFAESALAVPKYKRSEYVAHEVLQMKPLIAKDDIYLRFIDANRWVFDIFSNSKFKFQSSNVKSNPKLKVKKFGFWILRLICNLYFVIWISDIIESFLKSFQLHFINRHRTSEIVTASQLWFHPEDFEKKIKGQL